MATRAKPKSTLNVSQPRLRMLENYIVIWVDEKLDLGNNEVRKSAARLQRIVKEVKLCTTQAQCIEILKSLQDEKAFIISSAKICKYLVRSIHSMTCVHSIYIYCGNTTAHEEWIKEWMKIGGAFNSLTLICEALKKATLECDHDSIPMSFAPKSKMEGIALVEESLNQLSPTFMYSVLFKEIILEIHDDDHRKDEVKSMKNFIAYCRELNITQHELECFQKQYQTESAIWLYTCETFLYRMLNRALGSLDMKAMTKMAFFIRKLHRELEEVHKEQLDTFKEKFIVYRGQGFKPPDFQQLVNTKGGLLSFNNFLSTSKQLRVAMGFAHTALARKDTVAVLFIMLIDESKILISTSPFAMIDKYSAIPQEQEILFSMHTIFRVDDIRQTVENSRIWEVQLTLTDQNDPQLTTLTHRMREEICATGWLRMGKLMLKTGHFNEAEELYNGLLDNCSDEYDQAAIYQEIGRVKRYLGEYKEAIEFYEKSLEIYLRSLPGDHPPLANTYNNIGLVCSNMGDYSKALRFFEKAHQIKQNNLASDHPKLATSYHNMGQVYNSMGDYAKALELHQKAIDINLRVLPKNHPHIATDYDNIGLVYSNIGENAKALELYEQAHRIKTKALPPNHPNLAISYLHLATSHQRMGDFPAALAALEAALQIQQRSLSESCPEYASTCNRIGEAYRCLKDYSKALEYFNQSLSIRQHALSEKHPDLAIIYSNIGDSYRSMGDYKEALIFHEKALAIQENINCNPLDCATTYMFMAEVYKEMNDYQQASEFFEKALRIREDKLPKNHPDLAILYHNMAKLYLATHEYTIAMKYVKKSLEIAEEKLSVHHPSLLDYRETLEAIQKEL